MGDRNIHQDPTRCDCVLKHALCSETTQRNAPYGFMPEITLLYQNIARGNGSPHGKHDFMLLGSIDQLLQTQCCAVPDPTDGLYVAPSGIPHAAPHSNSKIAACPGLGLFAAKKLRKGQWITTRMFLLSERTQRCNSLGPLKKTS